MSRAAKFALIYVATLVGLAGSLSAAFLFGSHTSSRSQPVITTTFPHAPASTSDPLTLLLLQVVVIVGLARLVGMLLRRLGQPAVIGEMLVGIALGPSLLGWLSPSLSAYLFPASGGLNVLQMLSQVGVLLFMFVVGMELDLEVLRGKAPIAVLISHTSIVLPFSLGCAAAISLYREYAGPHAAFLPFALFVGVSMSITAFPVLARIIRERGLVGTNLGNTAITCAAVGDITAWIALAFVVGFARSQGMASSLATVLLSIVYIAAMWFLVRPGMARVVERLEHRDEPGPSTAALILITVFLSALFTEAIGVHALFGAFFAGAMMPTDRTFRFFLRTRLEYFSSVFLLPIFFASTGLRTQIGLLSGAHDYLVCASLFALAVIGKFGGSAIAARTAGMPWRESAGIGALMNTRGLIELIALNVGLDFGVLSPKIFTMLVLMAVVTTLMAGPILHVLRFGSSGGLGSPDVGVPPGREEQSEALV